MSRKKKSRDTSKQSAEEQRKTMLAMADKMNSMRTPMDALVGMQQNLGNQQISNFADMFSQMMGGANQQMQNSPGLANFMRATGQQAPQQPMMQAPQQPMMQAPQQVRDQMAAAAQPAPQPQQPPQPAWMANLTPGQQAAIAKFGGMGPVGRR